MKTGRY